MFRGVISKVFLVVLVIALSGVVHASLMKRYGKVPNFSLRERSGKAFHESALHGKVWIANFIYTHCSGSCPMLTQQMSRLARTLSGDTQVRFVSFSVDPDHDTPSVLKKYAKHFGADSNWYFLTGDKKSLSQVVQTGFHLPMGTQSGSSEPIHSEKLVLVDQFGIIRGYYDGDDSKSLQKLKKDMKILEKGSST